MFIRKRTYYSKRYGRETASYQVIQTYREGGKVKQRVIYNLGPNPSLNDVLKEAKEKMNYALSNNGICNKADLYEPGWRVKTPIHCGCIEALKWHIEKIEHLKMKMAAKAV